MKKIFIVILSVVFASLCLWGCENDEKSAESSSVPSSSSPFAEATPLVDGFELPIMPND